MRPGKRIYGLQSGEITWRDVCDQLRIARPTLYEAVKLKQIPVIRRGRVLRFRQDLIDQLLTGDVTPARNVTDGRHSSLEVPSRYLRGRDMGTVRTEEADQVDAPSFITPRTRQRKVGRNKRRSNYRRRVVPRP